MFGIPLPIVVMFGLVALIWVASMFWVSRQRSGYSPKTARRARARRYQERSMSGGYEPPSYDGSDLSDPIHDAVMNAMGGHYESNPDERMSRHAGGHFTPGPEYMHHSHAEPAQDLPAEAPDPVADHGYESAAGHDSGHDSGSSDFSSDSGSSDAGDCGGGDCGE